MTTWPLVALGDIFDIARGGSPRPIQNYITDDPDGVNWIMIADAPESSKYITSTKKRIRKEGVKNSRMVYPGDFLLTNSMSFGRPHIMQTSGCIHDGWLVLSNRMENVDCNYFFHLLGSNAVYLEFVRRAAGATVKNLNINLVKGVQVPFPPLEEQKRIAEILDRAEELRSKRREAIAELDTLTQAIFLEMFGDPVTNPKGWPSKALTEVCYCYSGGTPSKNNDAYWEGSLPWFSAKDIKFNDLFDSQDHINEDIPAKTTLKLLPKNTVVIVVRGMILAHTFPISVLRIPATINQDLKALLPHEPLEPQLLAACLRSVATFALQQVSEAAHGTKRLDAEGLRKIPIILPPLPLQQEFAHRVEAVEKLKAAHRASLSELDAFFSSLQHRAFRGEL